MLSLANGDFVNPNQWPVVACLIRRGLVRSGPPFELFDESFAAFVQQAERPQQISAWEGEAEQSGWAKIRIPLFVALLLTAGFFGYTQRDVTVAALTAGTAILPALVRLLGMFDETRGRAPTAPASPKSAT